MPVVPSIVQMGMQAALRMRRVAQQVGVVDAEVVGDVEAVAVVAIRRKTMLKVVVKTQLTRTQRLHQRLNHQHRQRQQQLAPNSVPVPQ